MPNDSYSRYARRSSALQATPNLQVTGLNDGIRIDRTRQTFHAFDGKNPREIDDAIRVSRNSSGQFKLEVAIVDGAQLAPDHVQTRQAITRRQSRYGILPRDDTLMLAQYVIRGMELRGGRRRATVIVQHFDADAQPLNEATVEPSWISTTSHTTGAFLARASNSTYRPPGPSQTMVAFAQRWFSKRGELAQLNYGSDQRLVNSCMVLANRIITDVANKEGVSIPLRVTQPTPVNIAGSSNARRFDYVGPGAAGELEPTYISGANFTSPLRIAAHLVTHQQIGALLASAPLPYSASDIDSLAPRLYVIKSGK